MVQYSKNAPIVFERNIVSLLYFQPSQRALKMLFFGFKIRSFCRDYIFTLSGSGVAHQNSRFQRKRKDNFFQNQKRTGSAHHPDIADPDQHRHNPDSRQPTQGLSWWIRDSDGAVFSKSIIQMPARFRSWMNSNDDPMICGKNWK